MPKKSWDFQKFHKNQEIRSNRHQIQRVGRVGTRLTVSPLVLRTGTTAKLKPPAQRLSVISLRRITEFDSFLIVTWTYVLKSILNVYESFKVIRSIKKVYSENEKSSHLPSWNKCRKTRDIFENSKKNVEIANYYFYQHLHS